MVNETFIFILTWVCLGVIMCYSLVLPSNIQGNVTAHRFCGSHLSNALAVVCQGNYNSMDNRRTLRHTRSGRSRLPFKRHEDAKSFVRYRRRRRGVSDECCAKPCSLDELTTFCGK